MAQIDKPNLHFNTKLYTGTDANLSITGVNFQPDLTWIKSRSATGAHQLMDAVRGAAKRLSSNSSGVEDAANGLLSFDTDGFSMGNSSTSHNMNGSGVTYVSWNWKAGNSAGSSNTDGSITSTVSANTTAGFSIVSYTGTGANATVGHGLGAVPKLVITKNRSNVHSWGVYHASVGNTKSTPLDDNLAAQTNSAYWNNTTPTSSVFTVSTGNDVNKSGDNMIAYCFVEKKGFSKFGSYTGNSSTDGTFIYTGFKPAFVIFKSTGGTESWSMVDNKRDTDNVVKNQLFPNLNAAEETSNNVMDFCSNGFKMRNSDTRYNSSSYTYMYMAFAENPIVGSNNIPATAR